MTGRIHLESSRKPTMSQPGGFTLIELLISTVLCLILADAGVVAYFKVTALVRRMESRLAMHSDAQALFGTLHREICAMNQDCALVAKSTPGDGSGSSSDTSSWTLIFMLGKENNEDWQWLDQSQDNNTDLNWVKWTWRASSQSLLTAVSSPRRIYAITQHFKPSGTSDFIGTSFDYLPQPRRIVSPAFPEASLNDNILFPVNPGFYPTTSLAGMGDYGDMQDLDNNLATVLAHVTACSVQLLAMNGTLTTLNGQQTATTVVRQGAWLDGRLAATLSQPQAFVGSDLSLRPRLIRLIYTVTNPGTHVTQTFSFSLPTPALAPPP